MPELSISMLGHDVEGHIVDELSIDEVKIKRHLCLLHQFIELSFDALLEIGYKAMFFVGIVKIFAHFLFEFRRLILYPTYQYDFAWISST